MAHVSSGSPGPVGQGGRDRMTGASLALTEPTTVASPRWSLTITSRLPPSSNFKSPVLGRKARCRCPSGAAPPVSFASNRDHGPDRQEPISDPGHLSWQEEAHRCQGILRVGSPGRGLGSSLTHGPLGHLRSTWPAQKADSML